MAGNMRIRLLRTQTRWVVRTERRLVGRLRCAAIPPGDDVAAFLRPARVKAGSLDGPLYHQPQPEQTS
jgi:hypothetical protein